MDQIIFAYGGQVNRSFIEYTAKLTKKSNPNICFLPTALADNDIYIDFWYKLCEDVDITPHIMKIWVSSYSQEQSFEDILLGMDAIIVGGGNTLNMIALWKAQGIDQALRKALERGIILAGGSAGSMCWFEGGTSDSRPKQLSNIEGLGFLPYSHCLHYSSEASRKPLYHKNILEGKLNPGYACDDLAGIVFKNGQFHNAMSIDSEHNAYFVSLVNGQVKEERLIPEVNEYIH